MKELGACLPVLSGPLSCFPSFLPVCAPTCARPSAVGEGMQTGPETLTWLGSQSGGWPGGPGCLPALDFRALADPHKPFIPLERLLLVRKPQGKVGVYVGCSALRSEPQAKGHCKCALAHLQHLLHAKPDPHDVQICTPSWVWMGGPSALENLLIEPLASEQEGTVWVPEARGRGRVYMQAVQPVARW